ncbi:GNAT family N-acetyltransferase [Paenibacillus sp. M1]|uniref:GNAT family N-acetyltransferase n=1 Tax=Paenibacillus haidiansis TaxID=1574488 RepID=A0ABU7VV90_9BACL
MSVPHPSRLSGALSEVERIVALEAEMTQFNARRALSAEEKNLELRKLGSTTLLIEPGSPDSNYYNRVIRFGLTDLDLLPEILDIYERYGISPCFDMTPDLQGPEVAEALISCGFLPWQQLAFLSLDLSGGTRSPNLADEEAGQVELVPVTKDNVEFFLELVGRTKGETGVDRGLVARKKGYYCLPEFMNWIARIGGEAAGICSLFLRGGEGYLANDYTFPEFRGQGCQSKLIAERIRTARSLGSTRLYVDVEFGGTSHDNMLKAGFSTVYVNTFWMRKL